MNPKQLKITGSANLMLCVMFIWRTYRKVKAARDAYIKRLNGIYETNLEKVSYKKLPEG